jgi:hypothetical protein
MSRNKEIKKMSVEELRLQDSYGRKLHWSKFAGQINVTPIVEKIGDTISLNDHQAHLLMLWLQEHLK